MLNERRARRGRIWAHCAPGPFLIGSLAGAFIVLSIMGALQVSASTPTSATGELSESGVNRTLRGDRSIATRMVRTIRFHQFENRNEPVMDVKLATGCEPFVSPLADLHLAHVAGRCVS